MDKAVWGYVDLQGTALLVGRLWARTRKGREGATFEYDARWLAHAERFSLEPALTLGPGPFHTLPDKPLFGAIGDSAPDRWGRVHGHDNLWVMDGGLHVTNGGVNPVLNIYALAFRNAARLVSC